MAAPLGNKNAANAKVWKAAIERALKKRSSEGRRDELEAIAEKLIDNCLQGDNVAIRELGDRLDGKPAQAIVGEGKGGAIMVFVSKDDESVL